MWQPNLAVDESSSKFGASFAEFSPNVSYRIRRLGSMVSLPKGPRDNCTAFNYSKACIDLLTTKAAA